MKDAGYNPEGVLSTAIHCTYRRNQLVRRYAELFAMNRESGSTEWLDGISEERKKVLEELYSINSLYPVGTVLMVVACLNSPDVDCSDSGRWIVTKVNRNSEYLTTTFEIRSYNRGAVGREQGLVGGQDVIFEVTGMAPNLVPPNS